MKRNGNNAMNKQYNPKNKKPDIPLDADEVDSAMERFIRKKYQEKSLADGRPEPPQRDDTSPVNTYSPRPPLQDPDSPPPPPVPSKKGKIFGFGLRASSSAYPFSKSDKKKRVQQEPRVDAAFPLPTRDYNSRMDDAARYEMTDSELQKKLATLRDMGFTETERNTSLLRRLNGNVERVIETLVRLGPRETRDSAPVKSETRPAPAVAPRSSEFPEPSNNPFTQSSNEPTVGLSFGASQEPATPTSTTTYGSNNPYAQPTTGLEQSFQSMQVSQQPQQALFPNSTGGYPNQPAPQQDPRFQYSMTPPVASTQYQQAFVATPPALQPTASNPFFAQTLSAHSTGSNPFMNQQIQQPPSSNPFLQQGMMQPPQPPQRQVSLPATLNPFGIPPQQTQAQPQMPQQAQYTTQDLFGTAPQSQLQPNNPFQQQQQQQQQAQQHQQQQQPQYINPQSPQATGPAFPNFQYAQPQTQVQPQQQPQQQMPQGQFQQFQNQQQPQFQPQNPYQQQSLMPQQTGRHNKDSIMALFNYPQRLATISEPVSENQQPQQQGFPQQQPPQQISQAPSDIFGNLSPAKRSATMPVSLSHMHSSGGTGNRNPFMTNTNASAAQNVTPSLNNPFGQSSPFASPAPQQLLQSQPQAQTNTWAGQIQQVGEGVVQPQMYPTATYASPPAGGQFQQQQQQYFQQQPQQTQAGFQSGMNMGVRHASSDSMAVNNLEAGRHSPDAFANLSSRYG
jgi:hypothetical protein